MISISDHETIYVWSEPVDMRRGFNGLSAMVIESDLNLFDGALFVFISKNRDRIKILTWTRGGLALWYKRLEKGRFPKLNILGGEIHLKPDELRLLLDGVDPMSIKRPPIWEPYAS